MKELPNDLRKIAQVVEDAGLVGCVTIVCAAFEVERLQKRVEWLEGLFDFSDPEVVLHSAPNDPVTKDAVVVLRSYYEKRRLDRPEQSGPAGQGVEPTGATPANSITG